MWHKLSDLPQDVKNKIGRRVLSHSVGIIRIDDDQSSDVAQLIGSGTLVHIDDIYGILTAYHVLEAIPSAGQLGLVLPLPGKEHRYSVDITHVTKISVAKGNIDSQGPDLAFILLPQLNVSQIKAYGTFYNLSLERHSVLSKSLDTKVGFWAIFGFPDELTKKRESVGWFGSLKQYEANCFFGGVDKEYSSGEYDYLELIADYKHNLPLNFGGISGGGLWHIVLEQSSQGDIRVKALILFGVVFYESALENNIRSIKCHGRMSVYRMAYEHITNYFNPS